MEKKSIYYLAINALLGALYFVLVFVFNFLSFSMIQFRIAEVLLVFVLFNPKYSVGLILGTLVSNLVFSPFGILDAVVGTVASMFSVIMMIILKKVPLLSIIMPAIFNGLIVGYMIHYLSFNTTSYQSFHVTFFWVFLGEFVVMSLIGIPLYYFINARPHIKELII